MTLQSINVVQVRKGAVMRGGDVEGATHQIPDTEDIIIKIVMRGGDVEGATHQDVANILKAMLRGGE